MKINYSKEMLEEVIKNCFSYSEILRKLGIAAKGGNYKTLKTKIAQYGIDISHLTGQGWLRNKTHNFCKTKIPMETILVEGSSYGTHQLKLRLIKEGYKDHKCECCNMIEWRENKIPLELHHVDGNNTNNKIENLQLLCPNCHAITPNYRAKNKNGYENEEKSKQIKEHNPYVYVKPEITKCCPNCKKEFIAERNKTKFCSIDCYKMYKGNSHESNSNEIKFNNFIITKESLISKMKECGDFSKTGVCYKTSRQSIKNWASRLGCIEELKKISDKNN